MKRAFAVIQKTFFISFKGLSIAKNCLGPETVPLRLISDILVYLATNILLKKNLE